MPRGSMFWTEGMMVEQEVLEQGPVIVLMGQSVSSVEG